MERQFRINWSALVEEAKQRRKAQKLTQQRLALLAGVSAPTISRFESGEKDIQWSTASSILRVLGMLDERQLLFPSEEAQHDTLRDIILFKGVDKDKEILCAISREALDDHFNRSNKSLLKTYHANRSRVQHEARRKYLNGNVERDGSVLIRTGDL